MTIRQLMLCYSHLHGGYDVSSCIAQCTVKVEYYQFYFVWHISNILISLNSIGKNSDFPTIIIIFVPNFRIVYEERYVFFFYESFGHQHKMMYLCPQINDI